jgi:hypothetical protein
MVIEKSMDINASNQNLKTRIPDQCCDHIAMAGVQTKRDHIYRNQTAYQTDAPSYHEEDVRG